MGRPEQLLNTHTGVICKHCDKKTVKSMSCALRMAHLLACVIEHGANCIDSDGLVRRHDGVRMTFAEELDLLCDGSGFTVNPRLSRRHLFQVFGDDLSRDTIMMRYSK